MLGTNRLARNADAAGPFGLLDAFAWLDPKELLGLPFAALILGLLVASGTGLPTGSGLAALIGFGVVALTWLGLLGAAIHSPCRAWLAATPERRRTRRLVREFAGYGLCFSVYGSLQWAVPLVNPSLIDPFLVLADRTLFGGFNPALLFDGYVNIPLTVLFSLLYFAHFPLFFVTPLLLLLQRRDREQQEVTLALLLAMYAGYVCYFLFPALGPLYGLRDLYLHPLPANPLRAIVSGYGVAIGTFPSLHGGISAVVLIMAWRHNRRLFWLLLPLALGIWASTVYLRYHYIVDLLTGWLLAVACTLVAPRVIAARERWHAEARTRWSRARAARGRSWLRPDGSGA
jgi:membrane-associated phospholipid phosphatase